MGVRWHVEAFEFESETSPHGARGSDSEGRSERHDGQQEFWTGKTWISLPPYVLVTKVPKFFDGYYLNRLDGLTYRRKDTYWYFWSKYHMDWNYHEARDKDFDQENMMRIGRLVDG